MKGGKKSISGISRSFYVENRVLCSATGCLLVEYDVAHASKSADKARTLAYGDGPNSGLLADTLQHIAGYTLHETGGKWEAYSRFIDRGWGHTETGQWLCPEHAEQHDGFARDSVEECRRAFIEQSPHFRKRKLGEAMGYFIVWLVYTSGQDRRWVGCNEIYDAHRAARINMKWAFYARLKLWGLVEHREYLLGDGDWRPTPAGREFVLNPSARVPSHVKLWDGRKYGFSETTTSIREIIGLKRYDDLIETYRLAPSALD